ncbi:MAG: glutamine-hydrolyzing GMP synthase [Candidatus Diapherotrites archaeon]
MQRDTIFVVDFGSQYTHLLARRIRELGVYSEIVSPLAEDNVFSGAKGIILSGGPKSVYDKDAVPFNKKIFELGLPLLGLCYGHQLVGQYFGGKVVAGAIKEYGKARLSVFGGKLFEGLPKAFFVWMSHGDKIISLPLGFEGVARTLDCEYAAIENLEKNVFGLQFHPEVTNTEFGLKIIENFVFGVCKCEKSWSMSNYLNLIKSDIKARVGSKKVFLLASGGVDSSVCLVLLASSLPKNNVVAIHIDTGFMRKDESFLVKQEIEKLGVKSLVVDAKKTFFSALKNVVDPEEKRNIIGKLFVDILISKLKELKVSKGKWLLAQGTIYPDTIETGGTENSNKIKTHHNRAPIIMDMIKEGLVIEPLKDLYKDEVRELAKLIGLSDVLINRRPFPGPGLAIRVLCSSGKDKVDSDLDREIRFSSKEFGYESFLLPVKAVGVQGDNRTYRNVVLLKGEFDYKKIETLSTFITNNFSGINRVIYLIEPKIVQEVMVEESYLTKERVSALQEADSIATEIVDGKPFAKEIWQFPVVLLPIRLNQNGQTIVLRPVSSKEAMTATFFPLEENVAKEIAKNVLNIKGIGAVTIDVTHKPPATIEWE